MELFNLNLAAGVEGGALSNKRVLSDDTPIVRTTPTPGNVLMMEPAANLMHVGHQSRMIVTEMPGSLANGKVACEYPFESMNGKTLAIHQGVDDHEVTVTKTVVDEVTGEETEVEVTETASVGNIASKAGHGYQFSSQAVWKAMGGNTEENVKYEIAGPGYVALGAVQEGDKIVARPYTAKMHAEAPAAMYLTIDPENDNLWVQTAPADLDAAKVIKFWLMEFNEREPKQARSGGSGRKSKKAANETGASDEDDALSLGDAGLDSLEDDDLGL